MKKLGWWISLLWLLGVQTLTAQQILMQKLLGGSGYDNIYHFENTHDGCYILAGTTRSQDGDLAGREGYHSDAWILKVNAKGNILWQKQLGGKNHDEAKVVKLLKDGCYVFAGFTESFQGEKNFGKRDFYVGKLDPLGTVLWENTYGGNGNDAAFCIQPLADGSLIVAGESGSTSGQINRNKGQLDFWVIKIDKDGKLIWQKSFGGAFNESVQAMAINQRGEIMLAGSTDSNDGDVPKNKGKTDLFLVKIDTAGNLDLKTTIGGESFEEVHSLIALEDNHFMLAGTTFSTSGDIKSNKGGGDVWLVKLNPEAEIVWEKTFGGSEDDGANGLTQTYDGNLILCGMSRSEDGDLRLRVGLCDAWIAKLKPDGTVRWSRSLGGKDMDAFHIAREVPSGDYFAVGYSLSANGNFQLLEKPGGSDAWICLLRDPFDPPQAISLTPTSFIGYVRDKDTKKFIKAEVNLVDVIKDKKISSTYSDSSLGTYQIVLPDTMEMNISFSAPGYMYFNQNVKIQEKQRYSETRLDVELEKIKVNSKITLKHIYFDTGRSVIRPESAPELERLIKFMNENPRVKIRINGHTDNSGNPATKLELSQDRANAVRDYLVANKISVHRITTKGFGMQLPVADNDSEDGRALNRRVEFQIMSVN